MENVVLIVHLLLALALIVSVLLQRSEGGGLGMGGGGGAMSGRSAATALSKVTWFLAAAFIGTSIALTIVAAEKSADASVLDRLTPGGAATESTGEEAPALPGGGSLLPPSPTTGGTLTPSAD